jgi:peptidyl-tRNA hydrolase
VETELIFFKPEAYMNVCGPVVRKAHKILNIASLSDVWSVSSCSMGKSGAAVTRTTRLDSSCSWSSPLFLTHATAQMLVLYDDLERALGKVSYKVSAEGRLPMAPPIHSSSCCGVPLHAQPRGSPEGHNGLRSLQQAFGLTDWPRLRIGIDRPANRAEVGGARGWGRWLARGAHAYTPVSRWQTMSSQTFPLGNCSISGGP